MDLKKTSTAYTRMTRSGAPNLSWARLKPTFGEHLAI